MRTLAAVVLVFAPTLALAQVPPAPPQPDPWVSHQQWQQRQDLQIQTQRSQQLQMDQRLLQQQQIQQQTLPPVR